MNAESKSKITINSKKTKPNKNNCKTAETVDEAAKLMEAGFEYVCEINGVKLFRKRK